MTTEFSDRMLTMANEASKPQGDQMYKLMLNARLSKGKPIDSIILNELSRLIGYSEHAPTALHDVLFMHINAFLVGFISFSSSDGWFMESLTTEKTKQISQNQQPATKSIFGRGGLLSGGSGGGGSPIPG